jgi:hypothetical protein
MKDFKTNEGDEEENAAQENDCQPKIDKKNKNSL